jgi:hypothetical protein
MAAGGFTTEYTMIEVAKSIGAQGNDLALVDTLSQRAPFLEEGYWMEADDFQSHHFMQALSEPVGVDSIINVGVGWDVATQTPVTELIQGLEDYLRIDMRILSKRRNPQQYVKQQCDTFVRGLTKTIHDRILYGNYVGTSGSTAVGVGPSTSIGGVSADRIQGLATRYNTIATNPWYNVTTNAGSGANAQSSTWALVWGPDAVFFVYPHGGQDFVKVTDMGEQIVYDSNQKPYQAYVVHFLIQFGLCVADPRKVQRLANINTTAYWTPTAQLKALGQLPDGLDGAVLYVPRFVFTYMQVDALLGSNKLYTKEEVWGHQQQTFQGVPLKMCERIATNEAVVS